MKIKILRVVVEELPEDCWSCELLGMCGANVALPTCCDGITREGRVKDCPLESRINDRISGINYTDGEQAGVIIKRMMEVKR